MTRASTTLPCTESFYLVCSDQSIGIFEEAARRGQRLSRGNHVGLVVKTLVGAPFELAMNVGVLAGHVFKLAGSMWRLEGKSAGYYLTAVFVLQPISTLSNLASRTVRIASGVIGILTPSASLKGWTWAEQMDSLVLEGRTKVFQWISPTTAKEVLCENTKLDPSNACSYFGDEEALKLYRQSAVAPDLADLDRRIVDRFHTFVNFIAEKDRARFDDILQQRWRTLDFDLLQVMIFLQQKEPDYILSKKNIQTLNSPGIKVLYQFIRNELVIPETAKDLREGRAFWHIKNDLVQWADPGNPLNSQAISSQIKDLDSFMEHRFAFGTRSYRNT